MKWLIKNWKYILLVVGLAVLITLIMDFNSRMSEYRRLGVQQKEVSSELQAAEDQQASLRTQIAYATSDAAVEEWAYEEGHMARSGDKVVVPLAPPGSTPEPTPTPRVLPKSVSNWQLWYSLFVDQPVP